MASRFLLDGVWMESGFVDHFDIFDLIPEFVDRKVERSDWNGDCNEIYLRYINLYRGGFILQICCGLVGPLVPKDRLALQSPVDVQRITAPVSTRLQLIFKG